MSVSKANKIIPEANKIIPEASYIRGRRIDDVWRQAMWFCVQSGYDYVIRGRTGSYIGQIRKQLDSVKLDITHPFERPLSPIMPPGVAGPTTDEKIEKYFLTKLLDACPAKNEEYTYGQYIVPQLPRVIRLLVEASGNTNQATLNVGNEDATTLPDPPCLRVISFKVVPDNQGHKHLYMSVFFRSWDLFGGLPENLGGLQLLKEYVLGELQCAGLEVEDGAIFAYSDGLHLYDLYFGLADMLNVDKIHVDANVLMEKEAFAPEADLINIAMFEEMQRRNAEKGKK